MRWLLWYSCCSLNRVLFILIILSTWRTDFKVIWATCLTQLLSMMKSVTNRKLSPIWSNLSDLRKIKLHIRSLCHLLPLFMHINRIASKTSCSIHHHRRIHWFLHSWIYKLLEPKCSDVFSLLSGHIWSRWHYALKVSSTQWRPVAYNHWLLRGLTSKVPILLRHARCDKTWIWCGLGANETIGLLLRSWKGLP